MTIPGDRDRSEPNDDSPRVAIFMRGLTIGALVGAAIAGSAIWERTRRRAEQAVEQGPVVPGHQPDDPRPDLALSPPHRPDR